MKNQLFSNTPIFQDQGLALVRILTGFFMAYHGYEVFDAEKMNGYAEWEMFKNAPSGKFMVYLGKGAELVGGLMLMVGLWTRIACVILAATMGYITFFVGSGKFWYEDQHPFLFVLLAIVFFVLGGGRWSLDERVNQ